MVKTLIFKHFTWKLSHAWKISNVVNKNNKLNSVFQEAFEFQHRQKLVEKIVDFVLNDYMLGEPEEDATLTESLKADQSSEPQKVSLWKNLFVLGIGVVHNLSKILS